MKQLIIGQKGIGKTILIAKTLVPSLDDYVVFDFCREYHQWIKDKKRIITFECEIGKLKEEFIQTVENTNKNGVLIIDNASLLFFPKLGEDEGYKWYEPVLKDRNVIMVFQSVDSVINKDLPDFFDKIYFYPTVDDEKTKDWFIAKQKRNGKTIVFPQIINVNRIPQNKKYDIN